MKETFEKIKDWLMTVAFFSIAFCPELLVIIGFVVVGTAAILRG